MTRLSREKVLATTMGYQIFLVKATVKSFFQKKSEFFFLDHKPTFPKN